ncbi:hypothetical protein C8J57DRAFT_951864, partial [Mycena rebaudengoi]
EPLTIPPIFDIFDVPSRLRESSAFSVKQGKPRTPTTFSGRSFNPMRPAPLPAPIVFDGPARPRVRPVVLHNQHKQPTSSSHKGSCAPILRSEPVLTMFDGPARSIR